LWHGETETQGAFAQFVLGRPIQSNAQKSAQRLVD
jgi:hypothetical protein